MQHLLEVLILCHLSFGDAQVMLIPAGVVVTSQNSNETFFCYLETVTHDVVTGVEWILNGSSLNQNLPSVSIVFYSTIREGVLRFSHIPTEYNGTTIQCVASINPPRSRSRSSSNVVTLLVQGLLSSVESLLASVDDDFDLVLSWIPPFTLDIRNTDPDITYCVDVVSSTSSATLHSECGITETEFTYPLAAADSGCYNYVITVSPVNAVGRGEQRTILYSLPAPQVSCIHTTATNNTEIEVVTNSPICSAELNLTDQSSGEDITLIAMEIGLNSTVFYSDDLRINALYNGILNLTNINSSVILNVEISTYDIVDLTILERSPLRIQIDYSQNSRAAGALLMFILIANGQTTVVDFSKSAFFVHSRDTSIDQIRLPFQLSPGVYFVFAYDIEENGIVSSGVVDPAISTIYTVPENLPVFDLQRLQNDIDACSVTVLNLYFISVTCTHSIETTTTQAGFLMIVQCTDSNIGQLLVNSTQQDKPTGPVVVQVRRSGNYYIAIFPRSVEGGIVHASSAFTSIIAVDIYSLLETKETTSASSEDLWTPVTLRSDLTDFISPSISEVYIIVMISGMGSLLLLCAILGGAVLYFLCQKRKLNSTPQEISQGQNGELKQAHNAELYAEIPNVNESFSYTHNMVYGTSTISSEVPASSSTDNNYVYVH